MPLPLITMADGSKTLPTSIGRVDPLPSISLDYVLHIPSCLYCLIYIRRFTRSLNCCVIFYFDSVLVQDRGMG